MQGACITINILASATTTVSRSASPPTCSPTRTRSTCSSRRPSRSGSVDASSLRPSGHGTVETVARCPDQRSQKPLHSIQLPEGCLDPNLVLEPTALDLADLTSNWGNTSAPCTRTTCPSTRPSRRGVVGAMARRSPPAALGGVRAAAALSTGATSTHPVQPGGSVTHAVPSPARAPARPPSAGLVCGALLPLPLSSSLPLPSPSPALSAPPPTLSAPPPAPSPWSPPPSPSPPSPSRHRRRRRRCRRHACPRPRRMHLGSRALSSSLAAQPSYRHLIPSQEPVRKRSEHRLYGYRQ